MVTDAEIEAAYRTVLQRPPETDAVLKNWSLVPTLKDLLEIFRKSDEYERLRQRQASNSAPRLMERWLLISNCQTTGLTNSLNLLNPDLTVIGVDISQYAQDTATYNVSMRDYSRILLFPEMMTVPGYDVSAASHMSLLPSIYFDGYHPDLCYIDAADRTLNGPMQEYHSLIAFAAYSNGLSVSDTLRLYNADVYERCGYFHSWVPARERLIADFKPFNIDLRDVFNRWGLRRAFMYSCNHPHIQVVYDVARLFLQSQEMPVLEADLLPADNLAMSACFPVYPELGEALGILGSYLFKPLGQYRYITLEQFVQGSFSAFSQHPRGVLSVSGGYRSRFERVASVVRGEA